MTIKELMNELQKYDSSLEVMTKKTEIFGNVGYVFSVHEDSFGFFGKDVPCVILSDEDDERKEGEAG